MSYRVVAESRQPIVPRCPEVPLPVPTPRCLSSVFRRPTHLVFWSHFARGRGRRGGVGRCTLRRRGGAVKIVVERTLAGWLARARRAAFLRWRVCLRSLGAFSVRHLTRFSWTSSANLLRRRRRRLLRSAAVFLRRKEHCSLEVRRRCLDGFCFITQLPETRR